MNKNFEIADFIVAFVKGISTQEQINGLAVWLEESESNRKFSISLLNLISSLNSILLFFIINFLFYFFTSSGLP